MALLFSSQEAAVRAAISADILTVWGVKKIHHTPPETETTPTDLPVAFIELADPVIDEEYSSMRRDGIRCEYTITGHFKKPDTSTLMAAKMAKASALRALLTTGQFYHEHNREWLGDSMMMDDGEATDGDYKVSIRFAVIILVDV